MQAKPLQDYKQVKNLHSNIISTMVRRWQTIISSIVASRYTLLIISNLDPQSVRLSGKMENKEWILLHYWSIISIWSWGSAKCWETTEYRKAESLEKLKLFPHLSRCPWIIRGISKARVSWVFEFAVNVLPRIRVYRWTPCIIIEGWAGAEYKDAFGVSNVTILWCS